MRERQKYGVWYGWNGGITPAYAGKTSEKSFSETSKRDHPRVCGKDVLTTARAFLCPGSPPRMRERPDTLPTPAGLSRITPAYAGKTKLRCELVIPAWDHPRVCGKDPALCPSRWPEAGSPPRMRERLGSFSVFTSGVRITPAYAGKTGCRHREPGTVRDHPRVCGKDFHSAYTDGS